MAKIKNKNMEQIYYILAIKYNLTDPTGKCERKKIRKKIIDECKRVFSIQVTHREIKKISYFGGDALCFSYATTVILLCVFNLIKEDQISLNAIKYLNQYLERTNQKNNDYIECMLSERMWTFIQRNTDELSMQINRGHAFDIFYQTKIMYDATQPKTMKELVNPKSNSLFSISMFDYELIKELQTYSEKCNTNMNRVQDTLNHSKCPKYILCGT